jgi:DNA-binding transcriptional regulator YiaG
MNVKQLRERTGLSQSKFAHYFNIPVRTIQKWERNEATPSEYIPQMMKRILDLEEELQNSYIAISKDEK